MNERSQTTLHDLVTVESIFSIRSSFRKMFDFTAAMRSTWSAIAWSISDSWALRGSIELSVILQYNEVSCYIKSRKSFMG